MMTKGGGCSARAGYICSGLQRVLLPGVHHPFPLPNSHQHHQSKEKEKKKNKRAGNLTQSPVLMSPLTPLVSWGGGNIGARAPVVPQL